MAPTLIVDVDDVTAFGMGTLMGTVLSVFCLVLALVLCGGKKEEEPVPPAPSDEKQQPMVEEPKEDVAPTPAEPEPAMEKQASQKSQPKPADNTTMILKKSEDLQLMSQLGPKDASYSTPQSGKKVDVAKLPSLRLDSMVQQAKTSGPGPAINTKSTASKSMSMIGTRSTTKQASVSVGKK